jgi:hypothetical protein
MRAGPSLRAAALCTQIRSHALPLPPGAPPPPRACTLARRPRAPAARHPL